MYPEHQRCSLLKATAIEYDNKTQNKNGSQVSFADLKDAADFARIIQADNIRLAAELERVKAERDAAIEALEKIMFQGGSNADTCSYCGNENCYNRGGHEICTPVWTGKQHVTKLLNCGECDQRFTCHTEPKDCDRLYHHSENDPGSPLPCGC